MFKTDRYVITPFINNSFDYTIKGLIEYFISEYIISENEKYKSASKIKTTGLPL